MKYLLLNMLLCGVAIQQLNAQRVVNLNLTELGAVANDGKDDAPAFKALLKLMQTNNADYVVTLPKGTIDMFDQVLFLGIKNNLTLAGSKGGTTIRITGSSSLLIEAAFTEMKMASAVNRKSLAINVAGRVPAEVRPGDLLHIQSNTSFETGWNYKENDILRIAGVSGNTISFSDPLIFNYQPQQETVTVKAFRKVAVTLSDLNFLMAPVKDSNRVGGLTIRGTSVKATNLSFAYKGAMDYYNNGLSLAACENVEMRNIRLSNLMYGVPMNFCRNIKAYNTTAEDTRHAYVPASACVNVFVKGLTGKRCHSVMDSHVSFNVRFEDIRDTLAVYPPDCRALGVTVINGRFSVANKNYQLYSYWSVQGLVKEYMPMYEEYDNYLKDIYWVSPVPGRLNGITAFSCRTFTIENCTTHNVAYYGDQKVIQKILIKNSRVGMIYSDANKVTIENTVMDGSLFPNAPYVFRFAGSGASSISGVKTVKYNATTTYLFGQFHNLPNANSLTISNSNFGSLKGWTDKMMNPGMKYNTLKIEKSNFGAFREEVQQEVSTMQPMLKKKQ